MAIGQLRQRTAGSVRPGVVRHTSDASGAARPANALVLDHMYLVRQIAFRVARGLPGHVEVDDVIQAGMIGLLEAARRYAQGSAARFKTYAGIRIHGAILDSLRKADWSPRSLYRRLRAIDAEICRVASRTGERPKAVDVAKALGISLDVYHLAVRDGAAVRLLSLERAGIDDGGGVREMTVDCNADPADELAGHDFRRVVAEAIDELPLNERTVLGFHYDDGLTLREIGSRLKVSESRVCQLRIRAFIRLRVAMKRWMATGGVMADLAAGAYAPTPRARAAASLAGRSERRCQGTG